MSIDILDVSHVVKTKDGGRIELRDINLHVEPGQHVALLGKKGSGIDQIIDLICGAAVPVRGRVEIRSEISWPIGESSFMLSDKSLVTNLRFIARIYEIDENEYMARMAEVADLAEHWNEPLRTCSRELRWRFAFALGVCLPFDIYIFDSPDAARSYDEQCQEVIAGLARGAGILVASTKGEAALQHCDKAYVLDDGKISYYEDVEAAVAHLDRLRDRSTGGELEEEEADTSDSDEVFDII